MTPRTPPDGDREKGRGPASEDQEQPKERKLPELSGYPVDPSSPPFLRVTEIFHSIQGESTWTGLPCTFVRLTGCPLRCVWCDTAYSFYGGQRMTLDAIVDAVREHATAGRRKQGGGAGLSGFSQSAGGRAKPPRPGGGGSRYEPPYEPGIVEITGGEPLIHRNAFALTRRLLDEGYTVLVETSGAVDVSPLDRRAHKIMDLKCPGSGEVERNLWSNLNCLTPRDEVKFVVKDRADWEWTARVIRERGLDHAVRTGSLRALLVSPVWGDIDLEELAGWILDSGLPVRFQMQLHKLIWGAGAKGV